jgi:hypothetical protein
VWRFGRGRGRSIFLRWSPILALQTADAASATALIVTRALESEAEVCPSGTNTTITSALLNLCCRTFLWRKDGGVWHCDILYETNLYVKWLFLMAMNTKGNLLFSSMNSN